MTIDDELERGFYEQQAIRERWSVSELKRQKKYALFLRLAKSQAIAGDAGASYYGSGSMIRSAAWPG